MPEPRVNVNIRLAAEGLALVDELANNEQRTRSAMLRILISEAVKARQVAWMRRTTPGG